MCVYNELMSIRIILCIIATILYIVWALLSEYTIYFIIYYPWLLTGFVDISWFFAGIEDMGPMVLKNFLIKVLNIICIFIFVKKEENLGIYFALVAIITLLANLSMYLQLKNKHLQFRFTLHKSRNHIISAILLFLPQLASLFYLQVDKVMLKCFSDTTSQVAFYDQAEKIVNIPFSVVTALSIVMMPRIANEFKKGNMDSINEYIFKSARFAMMISIPIFFGLDAIADKFIPWYLGDEYLPVIQAIWIISPIIITNTLVNISGTQYLTAINQTKILTISNVAAMINFIVNLLLIPSLGFYGAAIATVFSSIFCVAIQFFWMNKTIKIRLLMLKMWKYWISAFFMFIIIRLLIVPKTATPINTFMAIFIGAGIYFITLLIFKDELIFNICHVIKGLGRKFNANKK